MKKILKTIFILVVIVALIVILFKVKIKKVNLIGNTKYEETELISKIFENEFDRISIVFFIKDKFFKHKDLTYIEKYETKWETPFTIDIVVYEKEPIGFVKNDLKNVYFDKDGIINEISEERKANIPEVRGINFKRYVKGEKLGLENKNLLNAILNITSTIKNYDMPFELLEFDKDDNIIIYCGDITVLLGDTRNMEVKLQRLKDIHPEIKDLKGILDLREARDNMLDEKYIFKKTG